MLRLPRDWQEGHGGVAIARLFRQVRSDSSRAAFMECIVGASHAIMSEATRRRSGAVLPICKLPNLRWRINDWVFRLLPTADDGALRSFLDDEPRAAFQTVIVPPGFDGVVGGALAGLFGANCPTVFAIDRYVQWRMTFDPIDLREHWTSTFGRMIDAYNRCVLERGGGEGLRVVWQGEG